MTAYCADATLNHATLVVRPRQRFAHPMAHRDGIALLGQMLAAGKAWDAMTARQRDLVADLVRPVLADVKAGAVVTPPALPAGTRAQTVRSLRAKGLADADGRLTVAAVLAAAYGPEQRARRRGWRPVDTVRAGAVSGCEASRVAS